MPKEKLVFTITEASNELGISARAVRRAVERGTLAAEPMGAIWLVSREAIDAYQSEHRNRFGQSLRNDPPAPPAFKPARKPPAPREPRALVDVLGDTSEPVGKFADLVTMPEEPSGTA